MGIEIPDDMEQKAECKIVSDLFGYCKKITPSSLFRYRSCTENHISAFENDQLWLSKPLTFNDPHDSLLFVDKKKILNKLKSVSPEYSFEHIEKLLKSTKYRKQVEEWFGQDFVNRILKNATHNGSPILLAPEHIEIQNRYHKYRIDLITDLAKKSIKEASLVACFSEKVDITLMWTHYSANHTGFALNYDFKSMYIIDIGQGKTMGSLFVDNKIFPVLYSDKRYDATYYVEFHFMDDFFRHLGLKFPYPFYDKLFYYKSLLFKSNDWAYEKEWRIIRQTGNNLDEQKPDHTHFPNIKPKEIYLGHKISDENKRSLIRIARAKGIRVYQMDLEDSERAYKMKPVEIK